MASRPRIAPSLSPRNAPRTPMSPESEAAPPPRASWLRRLFTWVKRFVLTVFLLVVMAALVPPTLVFWLRTHAPPTTAFMRQSDVQPVQYEWVPATQIPEALRLAVIASEDQKFRTHWGFDFYAIAEALEHNEKSDRKRGASTITQQTAKNLFLWPSRSWVRKGLEVVFTLLLEGELTKDRILELYLNIVEFGPGIYGAQAAAEKFFGKPANKLTPAECAQLAAVLPNPRKWHADRPGPYVQSRADWILGQIGQPPHFSSTPPAAEEPEEPASTEGGDTALPAETPRPATAPETPEQGAQPSTDATPSEPAQQEPETTPPPQQAAPEPPKEPLRY